jgi:hypothetical protein
MLDIQINRSLGRLSRIQLAAADFSPRLQPKISWLFRYLTLSALDTVRYPNKQKHFGHGSLLQLAAAKNILVILLSIIIQKWIWLDI